MITKKQLDLTLIPILRTTPIIPDHISAGPFQSEITFEETFDQLIASSDGDLNLFCKIQSPDPECIHTWHIKGVHDTRLTHRSDGLAYELQWGAWSPGLCQHCGGTKRFSNHGLIGDYVDQYDDGFP